MFKCQNKLLKQEIRKLAYQAGHASNSDEHNIIIQKIKRSHQCYDYMQRIDKTLWTISYDNRKQWGVLTMNWSEPYNDVLKSTRKLPK